MTFVGTSPLVLGLTLAGVLAFVVLMYLLEPRQRRRIVPSLALLELGSAKTRSHAWSRWLRRLLSLLLALAIALCLVFAIADPHLERSTPPRRVLVLIDASASMSARDAAPTRLDAARRAARDIVHALEPGDLALVAQLDDGVLPLCAFTEDRALLESAIARVSASDVSGDIEPALSFARDVLGSEGERELWLVSDGNLRGLDRGEELLPKGELDLRYVRVGRDARNVGITHFSVRPYALDRNRHESIVRVKNFGPSRERITLRLYAAEALLFEEELELDGDAETTRTFENLVSADGSLQARISLGAGADALPSDDRAFAVLPGKKRTRVLLVGPGNRYLEAALLLDEYLEVVERRSNAFVQGEESAFDVVVFDGTLPSAAPSTAALYIAPSPSPGRFAPLEVRGEIARPFFDRVVARHPITRGLALADVNIASALAFTLSEGDQSLGETNKREPLLVSGARHGQPFVALAFDLRKTDLSLRVAFPLLLLAAIQHLAGDDASEARSGQAGETLRLDVGEDVSQATLRSPDGSARALSVVAGATQITPRHAGFYEIVAADRRTLLAANVPAADEGHIAPRDAFLTAASKAPTRSAGSPLGGSPWLLLAVVALMLMALEWLSFHRRWTT